MMLANVAMPDESVSVEEVDRVLRTLRGMRSVSDYQLGGWLKRGWELGVHRTYGYADFREYARRVFGFSGRMTEERLRVAMVLEGLPKMTRAFREGKLLYSVVRELTRVATAQTEEEWVDRVESLSARQVERLVSERRRGDRPSDAGSAENVRTPVTLRLRADTRALLAEARRMLTAAAGESLDDDELVGLMARAVLSGGSARDAGQSSYRIALTVCEECSRATRQAGGEDVAVDEVTVEMARCDAQEIGRIDGSGALVRASQTIPPKTRRAVAHRHGGRCAAPGCTNACFVDQHHLDLRSEGGTHDPNRIVPLCEAHHRAAHDGRLVVRGDAEGGFSFEHADGTRYGSPRTDAQLSHVMAEVFGALCAMGFRQKDARRLLDGARSKVPADADRERLLRAALARVSVSGVGEGVLSYGDAQQGSAPTWGQQVPRGYFFESERRARAPRRLRLNPWDRRRLSFD